MTVAERIKNRREAMGMTQIQLADKMGYKGKSSISKIESAADKVTLKTVERAARALDCTPSFLMGWTEELEKRANPKELEELHARERDEVVLQKYLSSDESFLIMAYRIADEETRDNIMHMAKNVIKRGGTGESSSSADRSIA